MRGIDELDHYELLEIARDAAQQTIDRAYRAAQTVYADGSLALYSVFESVDAAAIRERLDDAYRVLSDSELRDGYDRDLAAELSADEADRTDDSGFSGAEGSRLISKGSPLTAGAREASSDRPLVAANECAGATQAPLFGGRAPEDPEHQMDSYRVIDSVEDAVEEFDAIEDDGRGEFDGIRLRRNRLFRGYEIDDISNVTKVNSSHLRNIEAENFTDLPADVYVRGFVTAYAQTIGLDPKIVVPSYMARVQESRGNPRRGSFLARH
jgi:curved DNA-binding protein CbpA